MGITRRQFVTFLGASGAMSLMGCPSQQASVGTLINYKNEGEYFPVSIQHAFGNTVIDAQPQRIVTLGLGADEICLSLGVLPKGISTTYWGTDSHGYLPWFREYIESHTLELPQVIALFPEIDVEKIITLKPDIILAPQSGLSKEVYQQLSSFVRVVAFPGKPWLTPVNQQIEMISAALGKYGQGLQLIEQQKQQSLLFRKKHHILNQKTFAYIYADPNSPYLWCYLRGDQRVDFLESLGLELLPIIANADIRSGSAAVNIGIENVDLLNQADVVIASFSSQEAQEKMHQHPLFSTLKAIRTGGYLAMHDASLIMAMQCGTPLSTQWLLKRLLPMLETIEHNLAIRD